VGVTGEDGDTTFVDEQTKKLSVLKTLATNEFKGFTTVEWSDNAPNKRTLKSHKDPTFADIPKEALEKMLTRFLPPFDKATDLIFRDLEKSKKPLWDIRFARSCQGASSFEPNEIGSLGRDQSHFRLATLYVFLLMVQCLTLSDLWRVVGITYSGLSARRMFMGLCMVKRREPELQRCKRLFSFNIETTGGLSGKVCFLLTNES
jgi:hypothetical protein